MATTRTSWDTTTNSPTAPGYAPKYNKEKDYNWGVTLGGPIIKDKLFFFANYEMNDKSYPNLYSYGSSQSRVDMDAADGIVEKIKKMAEKQGVNYPGSFSTEDIYTKSQKAGVKLDWNINEANKFSVRWSLVNAKQLNNAGGRTSLNDNLYSYPFKSGDKLRHSRAPEPYISNAEQRGSRKLCRRPRQA